MLNWILCPAATATLFVDVQSLADEIVHDKAVSVPFTLSVTVNAPPATVGCTRRLLKLQAKPIGTSALSSAVREMSATTA
ncbi:MAG: hypothetical protein JNL62_14020 [Bryobacterales bacterium]|nr:hypothetical protein [Bryobacterales bacterium]